MNDGSRETPLLTAGLDLGDKYSYLCLLNTDTGKVVEEGRLRTTPEALRRRFCSEQPMTIAIEAGTHSPWVSRVLEEDGHKVLVANPRKTRLIYGQGRKTDKARCREVGSSGPSGPQAALAVGAPGRDISGAPGAHPLARGAGPLPRSAH